MGVKILCPGRLLDVEESLFRQVESSRGLEYIRDKKGKVTGLTVEITFSYKSTTPLYIFYFNFLFANKFTIRLTIFAI